MSSTITISSVDPNDDDFTASSPHGLTNGDSVKMAATEAPTGTVNGTLYYARVVDTTVFTIHPTRSDAKTGVNQIAISSEGTDVTFQVGSPQRIIEKFTLLVGHPGTEPVPSTFSDYSRELVFVEGVDTNYSEIIYPNGNKTDQVFMQGITTSPTYIFTGDAPKTVPTPPEVNEVWILS
jgi:hypothetical protein